MKSIKNYRPRFIQDTYRPDARVGRFLTVLVFTGIAFGLKQGVQDNYLADIIKFDEFERGLFEFFREMPGLLLIFILALMYKFADSKIFKIGLAFMTAGIAGLVLTTNSDYFLTKLTGITGAELTSGGKFFLTKLIVIIFMVIFSAGEHIIMPVRSTISMDIAKREKAGASLGLTTSLGQLGNIAGALLVWGLYRKFGFSRSDLLGYRIVFGISTALMIATVMTASALRETTLKSPRERFYFTKKFSKYYMLEVFYGSRKQIFLTFAPWVLIKIYGAGPAVIAMLYAICHVCVMISSPLIGKLIDKVGYKAVMVGDTIILVVVCLLYGYAKRIFTFEVAFIVVCCNFVLDQIISVASMASNVYVQRISSSQDEVTATLSTGISVNHVISILIALLGGFIWKKVGFEILFTISAFLGILNSVYAATIKKSEEWHREPESDASHSS